MQQVDKYIDQPYYTGDFLEDYYRERKENENNLNMEKMDTILSLQIVILSLMVIYVFIKLVRWFKNRS